MRTKTSIFQISLMLFGALAFFDCNNTDSNTPGSPSDLTYSPETMVFAKGVSDSGIGPSVTGNVSSYSISPALPAGLSFDTLQGTITGRATTTSPAANYVVTAKNAAGSTTITINLAVSVLDTTLTGLVQDIFNNDCTNCHKPGGVGYLGTGGTNNGLDLSVGASYADLVNHVSVEVPSEMRVLPGNADTSFLYQKVALSLPKAGARMPQDGPPFLTSDEITILKRWIQLGAPQ